ARRDLRLRCDVRGDLRLLPGRAAHRRHRRRAAGRVGARIVGVVAWTPVGALFAVPMDLAEVHVLTALARAVIGAATIVLVWRWWRRSIDAALTSALSGDASSGDAKVSPLVPRFLRPGPFGAVMGKSLRYWRRDTRYLAALGIYPVVLVFFAAMGFMLPESRP